MEKKIIWTAQAKVDLRKIYSFNSLALDEKSAFRLIEGIIKKTEGLVKGISGGTRYVSDLHPGIPYQKPIFKHYLIIFRFEEGVVFINKIFDSRQYPEKLKI